MLKRTDLLKSATRSSKVAQAQEWLDVASANIGHLEACASHCSCGLRSLQAIVRRARGNALIWYLARVPGLEEGLVDVALRSVEWPVGELPETLTDADEDFLRSLMTVPQGSVPDPSMLPSNIRRAMRGSR